MARRSLTIAVVLAALLVPAARASAAGTLVTDGRGQLLISTKLLDRDAEPVVAFRTTTGAGGPVSRTELTSSFFTTDAIAVAGDRALAAWSGSPVGDDYKSPGIVVRRWTGDGTPSTERLPLPGGDSYKPAVALDEAGDAVIVWQGDNFGDSSNELWMAVSRAGGPFDAPRKVGFAAMDTRVAFAADGRILLLAVSAAGTQGPPHEGLVLLATGTLADGFGAPTVLARNPDVISPDLAFGVSPSGQHAVGAWDLERGVQTADLLAPDPAGTVRKLAKPQIVDNVSTAVNDAGRAVVAWNDRKRVSLAERSGAATPTEALVVAPDDAKPDVAIDARGDIAITIADTLRMKPAGGSFGAARSFVPGKGTINALGFNPGLVLDENGIASVAYERSDGERLELGLHRFTATRDLGTRILLGQAAYTQEAPPSACTPAGAKVLTRTKDAVLTAGPGKGTFGCYLKRGVRVRIPELSEGGKLASDVSTAGPLVSRLRGDCDDTGCNYRIEVTDLRDPETGLSGDIDVFDDLEGIELLGTAVRADGAVAWMLCIVGDGDCKRSSVRRVIVQDSKGNARGLARSATITPFSLRWSAKRITWREGGRTRSVAVG